MGRHPLEGGACKPSYATVSAPAPPCVSRGNTCHPSQMHINHRENGANRFSEIGRIVIVAAHPDTHKG